MSSAVAGKYQDHYQILGVEFRADKETIQRAYSKLVQKYHPDNPETGDFEQFEALNLAYEVLLDPVLRKEFDKIKGIGEEDQAPKFAGAEFFESFGRADSLRTALLCVLCDRRRTNPAKPGLLLRHVEKMLVSNEQELQFALWYLKFKSLITVDDKSNLTITVQGVDFIEHTRPELEAVLAMLRPEAAVRTALTQPDGETAEAAVDEVPAAVEASADAGVVTSEAAPSEDSLEVLY